MNFNSLTYLIFFPLVLLLYWLLPYKFRWMLLLAASYCFYMWWNPWLVFLILGTTLVSYFAALLIEKAQEKGNKRLMKLYLALTLVICLGLLVFFKYTDFLIASAVSLYNLAGHSALPPSLNLLLPVGISFYTFQTLSYVIDVYWGKFKAERHFGYYALFVSFFPQLVAGPIEKPEDLLPQLKEQHHLNPEDMEAGFRIMLSGYFRKCVVADLLGGYVSKVFADLPSANSLSIFLAGFFFCFQMYNDFAGYSEIATGSARMMGIRLTKNFDRPYLSTSYSEFFRRWHISLNRWFTEYLYIPLGGSHKGTARKILNVFIVFFLCGLWHGANWTYVLWGLYAAFFVSLETLLKKPFRKALARLKIEEDNPLLRIFRISYMMLIFVPAGLIFRSSSLSQMAQALKGLFSSWGAGSLYFASALNSLGMDSMGLVQVVVALLSMCLVYYFGNFRLYEKNSLESEVSEGSTLSLKGVRRKLFSLWSLRVCSYVFIMMAVAICWLALYLSGESSSFAYFQF